MEKEMERLFANVDGHRREMEDLWKFLVNRDAGSGNKEGVDKVGHDIEGLLSDAGFTVRFHTYKNAGNMLVAEYGDPDKPFIVLTGHMDTVFADGTYKERPFTIKEGKVYGPGVLDMKGGITILLSALRILLADGYDRYRIKVILAGDEETGHRDSKAAADYVKEAKGAVMGFNLETGFMDNGIVLARKGCAQYRLDITGVGAHAGNNPQDGRSAVEELAHKILDIQKLTDYEEGTTVNCGVIGGGTVANAIPEHAFCKIDVRFSKPEGIGRVEHALKEIAKKQYVDHTTTKLSTIVKVASMERTKKADELFERAQEAAARYGLPAMKAISVGGGSDSAYLTQAGVPTLCALGVRGEFNHTEREYAVEESLFERTKLLIVLLKTL